jgi:formate dehydrogenase assembly factor FdhD
MRRTVQLTPRQIAHTVQAVTDGQTLNIATRAMHAAGPCGLEENYQIKCVEFTTDP